MLETVDFYHYISWVRVLVVLVPPCRQRGSVFAVHKNAGGAGLLLDSVCWGRVRGRLFRKKRRSTLGFYRSEIIGLFVCGEDSSQIYSSSLP